MNRDVAGRLMYLWEELEPAVELPPGRGQLAVALRVSVPDVEPEAVAAALLPDGRRAALVLIGDDLYIGEATGEGADVRVKVRRESLDGGPISVSMEEWQEDKGVRSDRVRLWTFERAGRELVCFKTLKTTGDIDYEGTRAAEEFALVLARKVGWDVPAIALV
jgi:hypothetical protein